MYKNQNFIYIFKILGGREHFQSLVYVKVIKIIIYKSIKIHVNFFYETLGAATPFRPPLIRMHVFIFSYVHGLYD